MISQAPDVATYVRQAPAERRAALRQLRALCRKTFAGTEECMAYGMAAYKRGDDLVFAFASQKQYIALYAGKDAADRYRESLSGASIGKGCIRFNSPEQMNFKIIEEVLRATAKSRSCAC